jgi:hypothetical protein
LVLSFGRLEFSLKTILINKSNLNTKTNKNITDKNEFNGTKMCWNNPKSHLKMLKTAIIF